MLQPSRVKHSKVHKGSRQQISARGTVLSFGSFGLKAMEPAWLKANQLESARRAMSRFVQRGGKIWISFFLICRALLRVQKWVWVEEEEHCLILLPLLVQEEFFLKSMVSRKLQLARH